MKYWIDAQLPPSLATWLTEQFLVNAVALRDIGLRDAEDTEIFEAARLQDAVVVTKDSDFVDLVLRLGSPPQILLVTCGNATNSHLRQLLLATFKNVHQMLINGEVIVEVGDKLDKQA
jgi:predicted nuclease of predicted toxin-antitoxin system